MACFVYTILGSWKDVPVGPTAIAAIMTRETLQRANLGPEFAVLLAFVSGCVSLLMGILQLGNIVYYLLDMLLLLIFFFCSSSLSKITLCIIQQLGFLLDFISGPVSVGFTSAASIIIATSQVKDILGIHVSGGKFVEVWQNIFKQIGETRLWDTALGIVCIIILLLLRVSTAIFNCNRLSSTRYSVFIPFKWIMLYREINV